MLIVTSVWRGVVRAEWAHQVDDVVDASVVHGLCGLWGMIATGLFTTKVGYARAFDEVCTRGRSCWGVCFAMWKWECFRIAEPET